MIHNIYCIRGPYRSRAIGGQTERAICVGDDESQARGIFHSKVTWGCAVTKGILFRTSNLAKGILFAILIQLRFSQGYYI